MQILAFCHWQRSCLSHQTSSLLWQVSVQTEAHLHPLPCAHWSLSNQSYTFAPSPALSSWRHKTTPGAAAPHHETSNVVGIIRRPGFGDEHHSSININHTGLSLKASMFRSSSLPESSPSSSLSAILNLVRMARRRHRSVPIHSWILSWYKVWISCRKMQMETLQHVANAPWRNMTWHLKKLCCANITTDFHIPRKTGELA